MKNIEPVDFLDLYHAERPTGRALLDQRGRFFALLRGQQFRVFDLRMRESARQNNRGGNDRTGQRATPDFIDAGDGFETAGVAFFFE